MQKKHWLLPEGIEELLPPDARKMELLRRNLLDSFASWGYELIMPPLLEYVDSLLTGASVDLDLQTFKLLDQLSGRTLGVRSDITTQAARIDAHQLGREGVTRLCYAASVLHTKAEGFSSTRSPFQIGAEIYGHSGIDSDLEVICLMVSTLATSGFDDIYLDIGHVGIFRGLATEAELNEQQERALFSALQRKAIPEIHQLVSNFSLDQQMSDWFIALASMSGDDALVIAQDTFMNAPDSVLAAVAELVVLQQRLSFRRPDLSLHFDLSELRGYHYHTGIVFAAYISQMGEEVARGGRYDHVGEIFGRARAACGFSADLLRLFNLTQSQHQLNDKHKILMPCIDSVELMQKVIELRHAGHCVIQSLSSEETAQSLGCDERLVQQGNDWILQSVID